MGPTASSDKVVPKSEGNDHRNLPKKPTPEIFIRIAYLQKIFVFYGTELYDAIHLASVSSVFREAVQCYSDGMWMNICAHIRKEPGFQQVFLDITRKNSTLLHWVVDCCFRQRELESNLDDGKEATKNENDQIPKLVPALDPNYVFLNGKTFLIEAIERSNTNLAIKLIHDIHLPELQQQRIMIRDRKANKNGDDDENVQESGNPDESNGDNVVIDYASLSINITPYKLLAATRPDSNTRGSNSTALEVANLKSQVPVLVELLVSGGARPVFKNDRGLPFVSEIAGFFSKLTFDKLLNMHANFIVPDVEQHEGKSFKFANPALARALVECETLDSFKRSPLIFALLDQYHLNAAIHCQSASGLFDRNKHVNFETLRFMEDSLYFPLFKFYFNSTLEVHRNLIRHSPWIDNKNLSKTISFAIVERKFMCDAGEDENASMMIRLLRLFFGISREINKSVFGNDRVFNYECNFIKALESPESEVGVAGLNTLHRAIAVGCPLRVIKLLIEEGGARPEARTSEASILIQDCGHSVQRPRRHRNVVQLARDYKREPEVVDYLDETFKAAMNKRADMLEERKKADVHLLVQKNEWLASKKERSGDALEYYTQEDDDDDNENLKNELHQIRRSRVELLDQLQDTSARLIEAAQLFVHHSDGLK